MYLTEDVDVAVHLLSEKLIGILDKMAPLKTIQIRKNYNPFISKETLKMMRGNYRK